MEDTMPVLTVVGLHIQWFMYVCFEKEFHMQEPVALTWT